MTAALLKRRELHADEIAEARLVFQETIDYDKIIVSNLEAPQRRKFTVPNIDGRIILGRGLGTMFESALEDNAGAERHTFIHEMTHAWQITDNSTISVNSAPPRRAGSPNCSRARTRRTNIQPAPIGNRTTWSSRHRSSRTGIGANIGARQKAERRPGTMSATSGEHILMERP